MLYILYPENRQDIDSFFSVRRMAHKVPRPTSVPWNDGPGNMWQTQVSNFARVIEAIGP